MVSVIVYAKFRVSLPLAVVVKANAMDYVLYAIIPTPFSAYKYLGSTSIIIG